MGRKRSTSFDLPKHVVRRKRGDKVYYYYDTGGSPRKEIALGSHFVLALRKYAELNLSEIPHAGRITYELAKAKYTATVLPGKKPKTQKVNWQCFKKLDVFFAGAPIDDISPVHIRGYLDWRANTPVSANQEIKLFSHMWNCWREWGFTDKANPAMGVKRHKERGRKHIYIEDDVFRMVLAVAEEHDTVVASALKIAYLTAQRPGDVVAMQFKHIRDGVLHIQQEKVENSRVGIKVQGALKEVIDALPVSSSGYFINSSLNKPFSVDGFRNRFTAIRTLAVAAHPDFAEEIRQFQYRDLRAKGGTDKALSTDNTRAAQKQLGHKSLKTTEGYIRKSQPVEPTR